MKLLDITLHPFAGIINRTTTFQPGLNVVTGTNEAGKSTLVKAILVVI